MRDKMLYGAGLLAALLIAWNLHKIFVLMPGEQDQGDIYRIIYFHVPSWFTCFSAFFVAGMASLLYSTKRDLRYDVLAVSAVEVGVVFTIVGLVTGSIWARIIWGIWWTWDPRLTWALITCVLYSAYLMMRNMIDDASARARYAAVLGTFSFASVAITYKAIDWWRTQHPGPVLPIRNSEGKMDPDMWQSILINWVALMLLAIVMVAIRAAQETRLREVEALRRRAHAL